MLDIQATHVSLDSEGGIHVWKRMQQFTGIGSNMVCFSVGMKLAGRECSTALKLFA